jgi:hypothetical protein
MNHSFALERDVSNNGVKAALENAKFRAEPMPGGAKGDTRVACDLKFSIKASNLILSTLHPTLRAMLYKKAEDEPKAPKQATLENVEPISDLPALRFPLMSGFKYDLELDDYVLTFDKGLGGAKSDVEIDECKVNNFTVECQEGGTVVLSIRVQCYPSKKQISELASLIKHDVWILLDAAEAKQTAIDGVH